MGPKIEGRDDSYHNFNKFHNWELEFQTLTLKKKIKKINNLRSCSFIFFLGGAVSQPRQSCRAKGRGDEGAFLHVQEDAHFVQLLQTAILMVAGTRKGSVISLDLK